MLALHFTQNDFDQKSRDIIREKIVSWFQADKNYSGWEPGGYDFLSPALVEAAAMRSALSPADFKDRFYAFLPCAEKGMPRSLFTPAVVSDPTDPQIGHLYGLNLSRAWCLKLPLQNAFQRLCHRS